MSMIHVATSRPYDICIRRGVLQEVGTQCRSALPGASRIFVATDTVVGPLYGPQVCAELENAGFQAQMLEVPVGERSKNAGQLAALWEAMMTFGLTRSDAVVALGGGMVGDLAGFAAATVLRGIRFVQIPTTLLAQVDSSVGGKVAIDLAAGKNLAGAFWQPSLVLIDPAVLESLPDRAFADGMAEVIKYGCIRDQAFFAFLCAHPSRHAVMEHMEEVIHTCCEIKRQVVEEDERDTGSRMILNFGHTVGHAFERAGNYAVWTHGQAVAAGMCTAVQLGRCLGVTNEDDDLDRLPALLQAFGLPTCIACGREELAQAIGLDKKGDGRQITLILLEKIGQAVAKKMEKETVLKQLESIYGR